MNIRELLDFHTRFKTNGNLFAQYVSAVKDLHLPFGVVDGVGMVITDTHKKLIKQAQWQNLLHKNVGYVRALCLSDGVQYYDVGLRHVLVVWGPVAMERVVTSSLFLECDCCGWSLAKL